MTFGNKNYKKEKIYRVFILMISETLSNNWNIVLQDNFSVIKNRAFMSHSQIAIGCIYSDLQRACFIDNDEHQYKKDAVSFFTFNGFPVPSKNIFNAVKLLCDNRVFDAGAILTGTFAYRLCYAGVACARPPQFHSNETAKIINFKEWDGNSIALISRLKNENKIIETFANSSDFQRINSNQWLDEKTGIEIILEKRENKENFEIELLDFLARDQFPAVVCANYGLPVAIPCPYRMIIYRLCMAHLRGDEALRRRDLALAFDLWQFCNENSYLVEMFEQLAELGQDTRDFLKLVLSDIDVDFISEDMRKKVASFREEALKLTGRARLAQWRKWKEKKSDVPLKKLGTGCC